MFASLKKSAIESTLSDLITSTQFDSGTLETKDPDYSIIVSFIQHYIRI